MQILKPSIDLYVINHVSSSHRRRFDLTIDPDQIVPMEDLLTVLMLRSKRGVRIKINPRNSDVFHDENDNYNHTWN